MKILWSICAAALAAVQYGHLPATRAAAAEFSSVAPAEMLSARELIFSLPESPSSSRFLLLARSNDDQNVQTGSVPLDPGAAKPAGESSISIQLRQLISGKLEPFFSREQDRTAVSAFYARRNYAPIWISETGPNPKADDTARFLQGVAADGLEPADYPIPNFKSLQQNLAEAELMLAASVLRFARHASTGRIAFSRVSGSIYFEQRSPDAGDVLAKVSDSPNVAAALDSFNPQNAQYQALKKQLAALRSKTSVPPASAEASSVGAKGKKKRIAKSDEPKTVSVTIDSIIANMERWRWMAHDLGTTHVVVNIPDYRLALMQERKEVWTTRIVVGKPGEQATPLLSETMKYITINPTWNVPPSIIRNEYLPALSRDPYALSRHGLKVARNKDGSIKIFQPPGDKNALGRIRFNFPNRFLVYQHDTPNKNLFARPERAFSHGCMRVQNPEQYAEALLQLSQPEDSYTAARVRAFYGDHERNINLKRPIPVHITYQTVFVDGGEKLQSRRDIYGLDAAITRILRTDRVQADVPVARNYNASSKPVMAAGR